MRYPVTLTTAQPSAVVNLPWQAQAVTILNPTINSVLVRVGGTDIPPTLDSASFWVPPASFASYPVDGTTFGVGVGEAGLLATSVTEGYPSSVFVTFIGYGEAVPHFGSMALGVAPPSARVIAKPPTRAPGNYIDTYDLPVGVRTLLVTPPALASAFLVQGNQSGRYYVNMGPTNAYSDGVVNAPAAIQCRVDPELDSGLTVYCNLTSTVGSNYKILGLLERLDPGIYHGDMRQMVDVVPPGQTALPVMAASPLPVREQPLAPAVVYFSPRFASPGVGIISNFTFAASGTYRVIITVGHSQTANLSAWVLVQHIRGAGVRMEWQFVPPGTQTVDIPAIEIVAGDNFKVYNNLSTPGATLTISYVGYLIS